MTRTSSLQRDWFSNIRGDVLAGTVVALALIPEAIGFSIMAGVDPKVGLYASFCIAVVIAFSGGRPAMVSAATGSMAVVMTSLVKDHGLQYLLAATVLTGVLQIVAGLLRLGTLMRFVSRSVITGFVNALAILIFMAQLPQLIGVPWAVYPMVAGGLAIIYLFPYVTKAVPSPLVAIVVLTVLALTLHIGVPTVGDMGQLPDSLPVFLLPAVPFNLETLRIILPYAMTLAAVGLLESLLTAQIVDDMTDTASDKNRECRGQGVANVINGLLGGMAGCAMIGQSVINVRSGGRGRLSTLVAGIFLLILVVFLGHWVSRIPMAALVAVMVMVSIGTFNWASIGKLRSNPPSSSIVMLATVAIVLATNDLAKGVGVGVLLSGIFFAHKVGRLLDVQGEVTDGGQGRAYTVSGQVFFASSEAFISRFDVAEGVQHVSIDVSQAHFWDITAVDALDKVVLKFRRHGAQVQVRGLNQASATLIERFGQHDKADASPRPAAH